MSKGWFWLSAPIVVLALVSSVTGLFGRGTYARETPNWAGQAAGQDYANLVAYVLLAILAVLAARGSMRAHLAWNGMIAYSVYTFAIYAFSLHFGRLFLAHVLVFGLSTFALIGGMASVDLAELKQRMPAAPIRSTAIVLIIIGSIFYVLWLSEVIPATIAGDVPKAVRDAGLLTNPVHVLDMGVLLPAGILAGVLLLRRHPLAYALVPTVLGCIIFLGIGIVAAVLVLRSRGEPASLAVTGIVSALTILEAIVLLRFLAAVEPIS
jgi:hypothetical protein